MYHSLTYQTRIQDNGLASPAEKLRKVFISYKKSDNAISPIRDRIAEMILECIDVAIWKDANLTPGVNYDKEIENAIEESDVVVLLLTERVLDSAYIWQKEIMLAKKLEKGIIPICVGISDEDLKIADERLDHRHCLTGPTAAGCVDNQFRDNLKRALHVHVMDMDLIKKISQFFASEKHKVSVRYLSYEQIFYMGCGYLSGIGTPKNVELSIPMLKSVIHGYGDDPEFADLKKEVSGKLFYHYAESNNPAGILEYALLALEYGNISVINEICEWYAKDRHVEMLSDMEFRKAFYQAVKKYGLREGYGRYENSEIHTRNLTVQKVDLAENKKSAFWVNGHEFYLTVKRMEIKKGVLRERYIVYLMRDDVAIDGFESGWIIKALFLYYCPESQSIHILESDFDHYGPQTDYCEYIYRNVFDDSVECRYGYIGSHQYLSRLPYEVKQW